MRKPEIALPTAARGLTQKTVSHRSGLRPSRRLDCRAVRKEPAPAVVYVPVDQVAAVVRVPDTVHLTADFEFEELTRYLPGEPPQRVVKVPEWLRRDLPLREVRVRFNARACA